MLNTLRAAVDSTIGKRTAAGAACFVRPDLGFDRFLVATMNPLSGQAARVAAVSRYAAASRRDRRKKKGNAFQNIAVIRWIALQTYDVDAPGSRSSRGLRWQEV